MKNSIILVVHAVIGWSLCGSIIAIGRNMMSMEATLIIHAIGAPIIFMGLSLIYFNKFNFTTPLKTALFFVIFIIFMDIFIVATFIEKSYEQLPPKQQIIFNLRFYQHYKIKEIADMLGCSESNVKTQLMRSVNKLKKQLKPLWRES